MCHCHLAGEVPGSPVKQATSLEQISEGDQLEPDTAHSVPSMTTGTHSMPLGGHDSAVMPQHSSEVLPAHSSILAMQGKYMYNIRVYVPVPKCHEYSSTFGMIVVCRGS